MLRFWVTSPSVLSFAMLEYLMSTTPGPPPFALPEYTLALMKFVHDGVLRLMEAKDPVWGMIPRAEPVEAVPTTQNTMPSGQVVQNNPVMAEAKFVLRYDDIRSSSADALAEQMDGAADQNLSIVMPHFFDILARTSQAAGTASNADGKPFTFQLFFASLEKNDICFDDSGKPQVP